MKMLLAALAALGGAALPLQALINARLGAGMNGPAVAATISFAVGTVGLVAYLLAARIPFPTALQAAAVPVWAWTGGLLGAFYVVAATTAVPTLGAAAMLSLVILGQMTASLLLDHFGVLSTGMPITAARATPYPLIDVAGTATGEFSSVVFSQVSDFKSFDVEYKLAR